jgi:hypothetical protein
MISRPLASSRLLLNFLLRLFAKRSFEFINLRAMTILLLAVFALQLIQLLL